MRKSSTLSIITIGVVFAIIGIVVIARGSIATNDKISIPALQMYSELYEDEELSESERTILNLLSSGEKTLKNNQKKESYIQRTYVKYLKDYFCRPEIDLSKTCTSEVEKIIVHMFAVMNVEKETDLNKMSLDGRGVVLQLFEQLYKLCGLKLVHNLRGNIIQISDISGNFIYSYRPVNPVRIHLKELIILLTAMTGLFSLVVIIARKNQLFMKEV